MSNNQMQQGPQLVQFMVWALLAQPFISFLMQQVSG